VTLGRTVLGGRRSKLLEPVRDLLGPRFNLAKLYQEQQRFDQALNEIDAAVKLAPDSGKVHFLRAQILQHLGKKDEAKLEFTTAKKLMDLQVNKDREELEERYLPNPELKQSSPN
jgi:Tfp pilus assembly protein PilF